MFKLKIFLIILLLLPLFLSKSPSKEDFVSIPSLKRTELLLNRTDPTNQGEFYFTWTNCDLGKSSVARLQHKSAEELNIFIFNEFDFISRKEEDDTYVGYLTKCSMKEKYECVLRATSGLDIAHTFWIIVKLQNKGEYYEGGITMFNEEEQIPLIPGEEWHIRQMYDVEDLYFNFTISANVPVYKISAVNHNITDPSRMMKISFYKYNGGSITPIIVDEYTNAFIQTITENGTFLLNVTYDAIDDYLDITVLLQKFTALESIPNKVKIGQKFSVMANEQRNWHYYIKLDNYLKNEEGVASIKFSQNVWLSSVPTIYSQCVTYASDEELEKGIIFPISTEEFPVQEEFNDPKLLHLHFKTTLWEEGKNSYLVISIPYQPTSTTLPPTRIDIACGLRTETVSFEEKPLGEYLFYINRYDGVPVTRKFTFSIADTSNYVIFFSNNKTIRYYEGDFIDGSSINLATHAESLFSFRNYGRRHPINTLSITLFGEAVGIYIKVLKQLSQINYFESRIEKTINIQITKGSIPYYYIADNEKNPITHAHVEEIYGNCEVYYKNEIKTQVEPIFPTSENKVNLRYFEIGGKYDLLTAKCNFPGRLIIHFFGQENRIISETNSKKWVFLPLNDWSCIDVKMQVDSVSLEVYSPSLGSIQVARRLTSGALDWSEIFTGGRITFKDKYFTNTDQICLNSTNENTVASVSFIKNPGWTLVTKNVSNVDYKKVIFYLPNKIDYSEMRYAIHGINTDFYYALVKHLCSDSNCAEYVPDLSKSGIGDIIQQEGLMADSYQFEYTNPYDKKGSSDKYSYYLALELTHFDEKNFTKYNLSVEEWDRPIYNVVPQNYTFFLQEGMSGNISMEIAELEQIADYRSKYVLIAHKSGDKYKTHLFQRSFYQLYDFAILSNYFTVVYFENLGVDTQIQGNYYTTDPLDYNCIGITYKILNYGETFDDSEITKFNTMALPINYTQNGTVLEWPPIEKAINYRIFIAETARIKYEMMDNDCYLNGIYEEWKIKQILPRGFKVINSTKETSYYFEASEDEFYVSIIAEIEIPMNFRVIYEPATIKDFDPTIPESSFIKINAFENAYFTLGLHLYEAYFTLTVKDITSDTIFMLADPMSPNVQLYVFDDLYAILRDKTGGNYTYRGFVGVYDCDGKLEIVHPGDKTKEPGTHKLYLIFANKQVKYDMTFYYFNERDPIPLDNNDAFYFDNMFSLNELNFTFTSYDNETTECIFKAEHSYIEQDITFYKKNPSSTDKWDIVKTSSSQFVNYEVSKYDYGTFLIRISSKNPQGATSTRRLISIRQKSWIIFDLKEDTTYLDKLVDSRKLYFKIDITNWAYLDENVITIYQNPDFEYKSISYTAKVVNAQDNDDILMGLMPKSEDESQFHLVNVSDAQSHTMMFFKKNLETVSGTKTFLLLNITFTAEKTFFTPRNFTVSCSEKIEKLIISSLQPEQQHLDYTVLKDYIPKITKYSLADNDTSTYLIYVNSLNSSIFFLKYLVDDNGYVNPTYKLTEFFTFSNAKQGHYSPNIKYFYVVYFNDARKFETITLRTLAETTVISNDRRDIQDIEVDIRNCENPRLILGSYNNAIKTSFAYIEHLYGSFSYYYKGKLIYDEEEQQIMPSDEDQVGYFFNLGERLDLLKISCKYPGKILLHILDTTSEIEPDERNYFLLPGGQDVNKIIPWGEGFDIEIANHLSATISGECYTTPFTITPEKNRVTFHMEKLPFGANIDFRSDIDTVVMVNFVDKENMYRILDDNAANISAPLFMVYLPASRNDYAELRIDIKRLQKDIRFIFGRCSSDNEPQFIPSAENGTIIRYESQTGHIYHTVIDNPSNKYNSSGFTHFIAFHMGQGSGLLYSYDVEINYVPLPIYQSLQPEEIAYLAEQKHIAFNEVIQIDRRDTNYYLFAAKKCGLYNQNIFVNNYYQLYTSFDVTSEYSAFIFKNIGLETHIKGNYESTVPEDITGFEFSYKLAADPDQQFIEDIIQFNSKTILHANFNNSTKTVTWSGEPISDKILSYSLYALDKTIDKNLITNDCFLVSQQRIYASTGRLPQYFYSISGYGRDEDKIFTITYDKNSYVVIVATVSVGVHLRVTFPVLDCEIKNEPIPEDQFHYLLPYREYFMVLNKNKPEDYFKFQTQGLNTDTIFKVNEGLYTDANVTIYFYTSTESIIVNEDREFSNYISASSLTKGETDYILQGNPLTPPEETSIYVVVRNSKLTNFDSNILIFNEVDQYDLGSYESILINRFYSTQKLVYGFSSSLGDVAEFSIINQYSYNTHLIVIYEKLNGEYVNIYNTTSSDVKYNFKEDDSGYFKVEIISSMPKYSSTKKIISFQRTVGELIDLFEGKKFETSVIFSKPYIFKYIMSSYEIGQEGVITLFIPNVYRELSAFKGFYAKVVSFNATYRDYEKDLVKLAPLGSGESDFEFKEMTGYDGYYELFFKKTIGESTGETLFLLITVNFFIPSDFFDISPFQITISNKCEIIDLRGKDYPTNIEITDSLYVEEYVPRLIQYLLPESLEDQLSMALWFSHPGIVTYYSGNLLNEKNKINTKASKFQLFSVTNSIKVTNERTNAVSVVLFGPATYGFIRRVVSTHPIINVSGIRKDQSYSISISNCETPTVLLAEYSNGITGWLTTETLYGVFQFYYKGTFIDGNEKEYILPKYGDVISKEASKLSSKYDVLTISCTRPGKVMLHIFDELYPENPDGRTRMVCEANKQSTLYVPEGPVKLEVESNTKEALITFKFEQNTTTFNSSNIFRFNIDYAKKGSYVTFTSDKDAVISVNSIVTEGLITQLNNTSYTSVNYKNFALLLPKDKTIADTTISFSGLNYSAYYAVTEYSDDISYVALPQHSGYDDNILVPSDNTFIRVNNMYDKFNSTNKSFIIVVSLIIPENENDLIPYSMTITNLPKGTVTPLKEDVIGVVSSFNDKSFYTKLQLDTSPNEDVYYFVVTHECGSDIQSLRTTNYREFLDDYPVLHDQTFVTFKNYLMEVQISSNTTSPTDKIVGLEVSYFIVQSRGNQILFDNVINKRIEFFKNQRLKATQYTIEYNRYKETVSWSRFDQADSYQLFLIRQDQITRLEAQNDCRLFAAYQAYLREEMPSGFESISTFPYNTLSTTLKVSDDYAYYIAIVAVVGPPLPFRMEYEIFSLPKYEPIIPEDHFKNLTSTIDYRLVLSLHKTDEYFFFLNSNENTDMLFRIKEGMYREDTKIEIYIYNELRKIERDSRSNFQNADVIFTMRQGQTDYIIKHTEFSSKLVYIVMKNFNKTSYSSDVMIQNERDLRKLVPENPFLINQFLSTKEWIFNFTTVINDVVDCVVTNEISTNGHQIYIYEIYKNGTETEICQSKNSTFRYHFKEDDEGTFKLLIRSDMTPYSTTRKIVQLEKSHGEFDDLLANVPITFSLLVSRPYHFKVVLETVYEYGELGIVTLYLSHELKQLFNGFYGKIVVAEDDDESKLIKLAPKSQDESEFILEEHPDGEHYHLHFLNNKKPEVGKLRILLITLDLNEGYSFFEPREFGVGLSDKETKVELDNIPWDEEQTFSYYVPAHVAKIVTFQWFVDEYQAHIFLSPGETVCTFYNGTYISRDGQKINEDSNDNLLYALATKPTIMKNAYFAYVSMKLFAPQGAYSVKLVKVKGQIVFQEGVKKENSYFFEVTECSVPSYFIESYDEAFGSKTYIQFDYGSADLYFRSDYSMLTRDDILPKSMDIIDTPFVINTDIYSILRIDCITPVRGSIHVFDNIYENPLIQNARYRFYVSNIYFEFNLPRYRPLYISAQTPFTSDIFLYMDGSRTFTIEKGKPMTLILEDYSLDNKISFYSLSDSYFELSIVSNPNLYEEYGEGVHSGLIGKNVVIYIPPESVKKRLTSYQLKMTNVTNDFIYSFMRTPTNDRRYLPLPSLSGFSNNIVKYQKLRNKEFTAFASGIFDKFEPDQSVYCFCIEFIDNTTNTTNSTNKFDVISPYTIEVTFNSRTEYPILKKKIVGYLSNKKTELEEINLELEDCSDYNEEYVFFTFWYHGNKLDHIYFKNFENIMIDFNPNEQYTSYYIENPKLFMQMAIGFWDAEDKIVDHSGMGFAYSFTDYLDMRYVSFINTLKYRNETVKHKKNKLSWNPLNPNYQTDYEIFLFEKGILTENELKNEILLRYLNLTKDSRLIKHVILKDKYKYSVGIRGKFDAVVVAEIHGTTPMRYIYKPTTVNGGIKWSDYWWIILIIVLLGAIIIAGIVYYFLIRNKKKVVLPTNYDPLMGSISQ